MWNDVAIGFCQAFGQIGWRSLELAQSGPMAARFPCLRLCCLIGFFFNVFSRNLIWAVPYLKIRKVTQYRSLGIKFCRRNFKLPNSLALASALSSASALFWAFTATLLSITPNARRCITGSASAGWLRSTVDMRGTQRTLHSVLSAHPRNLEYALARVRKGDFFWIRNITGGCSSPTTTSTVSCGSCTPEAGCYIQSRISRIWVSRNLP